MTKQRFTPAYPAELRERGVRLFRENRAGYASDTAADTAIAPKLGCSPDSLRVWCQQAERDAGQRAGLTSAEKDRIKELEREVRELRQANEILKKGEPVMAPLVQAHWRTHISLRRSSTARSADDRVHR
jgi:transposase